MVSCASLAYGAFKAIIGYHVLKAKSADEINTLFEVVRDELPLEAGMELIQVLT